MVTKRTPKELYNKSVELYNNIRKKGKNGQSSKWAYYYCKCILNGKKDVPQKFVQADAKNVTGQSINQKLTKAEYTAKMKKYCEWVEKHKSLPNYITIKDKKIKPKIWNAYVGCLYKVYYETGKLPASQPIKSNIYGTTSTNKKHGHATKSGCDNRGQNNGYYCGCHSLQEVFRNLTGKVVPQSTIASVAGTTTSGTDHGGLNTAVAWFAKKYGYNLSVEWKNFSDLGWSGIKKIIDSNNQDCVIHNLYRNKWGHYEVINKVSNDNIKVQNSLGYKCTSSCYCGYEENRSPSTFRSYMSGISQKSVMIITRK